jgi:uncharacterized glyoxalase superfamily protein PhnB
MNFAKDTRSTVIPGMRYRDCHAAIDWLCKALGFEKRAVFSNPEGIVVHAELSFGNGMIMIGSVVNGAESTGFTKQPDQIGNCETQASYLIVNDADAVYASAKAAGAGMILDIADMHYGGRAFSCRDPEGHIWHVGTYDPWTAHEKS